MKQLYRTGKSQYVVENTPAPSIGDKEVLIEVRNSLISSGTEVTNSGSGKSGLIGKVSRIYSNSERVITFLKAQGLTELRRKIESREHISVTSGYSVAGIVIAKGDLITDLELGDRVAAAGAGIASHAEIVAIPRNLVVKLPADVSYQQAAFTTVGSIALQGVRQAQIQVAETVVVVGLGLIGLITIQILKASGCRVIGVDIHQQKVDKALELGADFGLVSGENTVVEDVLHHTNNLGADCVILCAGTKSSKPVNDAMSMVRQKGRVVVVGAVGMEIERAPFYQKEVEFTISCSYGPGRYDHQYEIEGIDYPAPFVRWTENRNMQAFLWMLEKEKFNVMELVTDSYTIDDAPNAFEKILTDPGNTLAVQLEYPERTVEDKIKNTIITYQDTKKIIKGSLINIAVIGAGGFARETYLPFIYGNEKLNLTAVATKSGTSAKKMALDYKADYSTTDYLDILKDESVDAVIITARHNLHYKMAKDAIKHNKHVLLEKPMCMTESDLDDLVKDIADSGLIFAVGHNRRYSSLATEMKKLISKELAPAIINYRINAGHIPLSHWTQMRGEGGGRVIGEGCHFFDFINFLIPGNLVNISVEKCPVDSKTVISNDNYIVVLIFDDGSIGTVTYTSLGHKDMPKEYIEVFVNQKSMIMDDFNSLKLYGFNHQDIILKQQDKGQEAQLTEFINSLSGKASTLITLNDSVLATRTCIIADSLLSE